MDWARTVAVVVPSPAVSLVLLATSLTIWAPMFSNLSSSSISLATVTPSLVTVGDPQDFSMTTLRPRGPRVTATASARVLTPESNASRAFAEYLISLPAISNTPFPLAVFYYIVELLLVPVDENRLFQHAHHIILPHNHIFLIVDFYLGAAVFAEQDTIPLFYFQGPCLAVITDFTVSHGDHVTLDGFFLGGLGNNDPPFGLGFLFHPLYQNSIMQRS